MTISSKRILAAGVAGMLVASAVVPATAAPVLSNTALVKSAGEGYVTDVRWRGGGAVAAGVLGGLALGALASGAYYGRPYYPPPYYAPPYYGPPPAAYYVPEYDVAPPVYYRSYSGGDRLHNSVGNY
jgi:hypothetical protein